MEVVLSSREFSLLGSICLTQRVSGSIPSTYSPVVCGYHVALVTAKTRLIPVGTVITKVI